MKKHMNMIEIHETLIFRLPGCGGGRIAALTWLYYITVISDDLQDRLCSHAADMLNTCM